MRIVLALLCLAGAPALAATSLTADVALGTDDNLLNARDGTPALTEQSLQLGLSLAASTPLQPGLTARGIVRTEARLHARHEGLNELGGSAEGQLLLRPGSGFYTPTLGLAMAMAATESARQLRDAKESRLRLFARENLTTQLALRASGFVNWRGSESRAFDSTVRGGELGLDWQAMPRLGLGLSWQHRRGEVAVVGTPAGAARANALAIEPDDVFAGRQAFSFAATTQVATLTANYALSPSLVADAQLRHIASESRFGSRYTRVTVLTGLLYRF